MPLISFSWYIALAEISSIALIEEEGIDILVSFLIAGKETFAAKCKICFGLFADALYKVKAVPFDVLWEFLLWTFPSILVIFNWLLA